MANTTKATGNQIENTKEDIIKGDTMKKDYLDNTAITGDNLEEFLNDGLNNSVIVKYVGINFNDLTKNATFKLSLNNRDIQLFRQNKQGVYIGKKKFYNISAIVNNFNNFEVISVYETKKDNKGIVDSPTDSKVLKSENKNIKGGIMKKDYLDIDLSDLKSKILELNSNKKYIRIKFNYRNLDGFGVYSDKLEAFAGVATIHEDKVIFKKTWDSRIFISLHQIETHDLKIVKFNKNDLKRCWNSSNDFLIDFKKDDEDIVDSPTNFKKTNTTEEKTKKKNFNKLLKKVKEVNPFTEWYPTSKEVIKELYSSIKSSITESFDLLDVGAGNGKVLSEIKKLSKDEKITLDNSYAIEKDTILSNSLDKDIIVIGSDFNHQTYIDKNIDITYCNPPYSEFSKWSTKLIEESNSKLLYLLIPERWKNDDNIAAALKSRNAAHEVIYNYDFINAEDRAARAKVDLIKIDFRLKGTYGREQLNVDPFELWLNNTFKLDNLSDKIKSLDDEEKKEEKEFKELVAGSDLIETLTKLYDKEMNNLMNSYRSVSELHPSIFKELDIKIKDIKSSIHLKIKGLKHKYWSELFNNLDKINDKLTAKSRNKLLNKLNSNLSVDFTSDNAKMILIYVLKNANNYFDEQLKEVYLNIADIDNIKKYKSNQRIYNDRWRFLQDGSHYSLDYRIVTSRNGGFSGRYEYGGIGTMSKRGADFIKDLTVISNNLGFKVDLGSLDFNIEAGEKNIIKFTDGADFLEFKVFLNGNIHLKFNQKFMKAFNVEAARLNGWIRKPSEAVDEFNISEDEANELFNTNLVIDEIKDLNIALPAPKKQETEDKTENKKEITKEEAVEETKEIEKEREDKKAIGEPSTNFSKFENLLEKQENSKKTSYALASANIKKELKANFPSVKFSVKSSSYSGGDSVHVSYTDGVQEEEVEKIANKYQSGSFNSYEDIYEYNHINDKYGSAKYVLVLREYSEQSKKEAFEYVSNYWGDWEELREYEKEERVQRYLREKDFTPKTKQAKTVKKQIADADNKTNDKNLNCKEIFDSGDVADFVHTKTNEVLKLLTLNVSLSKEDFLTFKNWIKSEDLGFYSRFAKGFILNKEISPNNQVTDSEEVKKEDTAPSETTKEEAQSGSKVIATNNKIKDDGILEPASDNKKHLSTIKASITKGIKHTDTEQSNSDLSDKKDNTSIDTIKEFNSGEDRHIDGTQTKERNTEISHDNSNPIQSINCLSCGDTGLLNALFYKHNNNKEINNIISKNILILSKKAKSFNRFYGVQIIDTS